MATNAGLSSSNLWSYPESCSPLETQPVGICEVVSVNAADELPYVFELLAGQRLKFSVSATHEMDLVLCDEFAYDAWMDGGLQTEYPPNPLLRSQHTRQHTLEYLCRQTMTLVVILINLADAEVHALVGATVLARSGKPC